MERLTKRAYSGITYNKTKNITCSSFCSDCSVGTGNCNIVKEMVEKLANLEDAEEQGLLVRLPCKVGDTVFADSGCFGILEYEVDEIIIEKSITYRCSAYSEPIGDCPSECLDEIEPDISYFGKTVFLTREEAEAKLKEMEGNHDGE